VCIKINYDLLSTILCVVKPCSDTCYRSLYPSVAITTQPSNVTVCSGGVAVFTCVLSGPSITAEEVTTAGWHIKGIQSGYFLLVSRRSRHTVNTTVIDGMLFDTLTITNVSHEDEGSQYRCVTTHEVISNVVSITITGIVDY